MSTNAKNRVEDAVCGKDIKELVPERTLCRMREHLDSREDGADGGREVIWHNAVMFTLRGRLDD